MEGTFKNGDGWTGESYDEDNRRWFRAVDKDGREYDTEEVPTRFSLFTLTQFVGPWSERDVRSYWERNSEDR